MRLARGAVLACVLACVCALAGARAPGTPGDAQELYQDALQSLAEGRKNDASAALMRVIEQEPRHAGAWLEVALIQCELGHNDEAERLFATIETRFDPPPEILKLINQARESGCSHWDAHASSAMSVGRGIDRNVNQGASNPNFIVDRGAGPIELPLLDDFLPKRDQYSVLSLDYLRDLTPNGSVGFVQFQARRNDHLHQYDSGALFTGVESPWRFGGWTVRGSATVGLITLGGALYQRQLQLQARVAPPLQLPGNALLSVLGGITLSKYSTLVNFDSRTAELRPQLSWRDSQRYVSASVAYSYDQAVVERPGGDRHGTMLNLLGRHNLPYELVGELAYSRQTWNSATAYAPALLIDEVRAQRTQVLRANLSYPVAKNQTLQLELRAVRNQENISIFQYNNRQLQFSWNWQGL